MRDKRTSLTIATATLTQKVHRQTGEDSASQMGLFGVKACPVVGGRSFSLSVFIPGCNSQVNNWERGGWGGEGAFGRNWFEDGRRQSSTSRARYERTRCCGILGCI